ncbi:hypothetical protein HA402_005854 [Bradysia odoriphaga]|nr:hypothetical protein HA402_005854 [Bradysia odoriphaga]
MKLCIVAALSLVTICSTVNKISARTSNELRLSLPNGSKLVGRHLRSHDGKGIRAFMGIPYAEPPVADLRFRAPVMAKPWSGERLAVKDSDMCIQRDPFRRDVEIEGSEDCLYLNVYTPQFPQSDKPLEVMVFFHGGGWQCGSGISAFYGPDHLMDHDIIYVGANFRLGPLGFLSTGQEDCPGNNGLKDQTMVLRWIQENIGAFGGDKNKVTIFGESAGGASVTYHMMSPLSKGLFQKGISQSGTNLDPWAQPAHENVAPTRAAKLGEIVGCPKKGNDWSGMIKCLRTVDAADITKAFYDFFEWDTDPMIPFPPVVEPDLPGAFITQHPRDVYEPHAISIPWMTGLTSDEGAMKSAPIINLPELYTDFNANTAKALPVALNYNHHGNDVQTTITKNIQEYYFNNGKLSKETHQNLTNLFTDGWFLAGMDEYLRIRLLGGNKRTSKPGPTYVYLFSHKGQASFTEIFKGGRENFYGACHAEELQYLFPIGKDLFISAAPTKSDTQIRKAITELWVNFAKTGNPTPPETNLPKWKPTKGYPLDYLRIGNMYNEDSPLIDMEIGLMDERAEFWRKLQAHSGARYDLKDEL